MNQARITNRIIRRETHSSRSGLSIPTAILVLAACLWLGTESILSMLGQPALLASPGHLASLTAEVPHAVLPAGLVAGGAVLALVGAGLLVAAVKGGRRGRRAMVSDRSALVVDDEAIAAAISRKVRLAANLAPEQVATTVARNHARVSVRPTSGITLDPEVLTAAAADEVAGLRLRRALRARVHIATEGAVGR
ncbi:hypothetical protein [Pseudarthrobacter sp. C4D7]|uniref:hypothetical protein n=1 Tax=Pseudarthrobacter sp. C4D7 TaxID=2735268 RepID=UPI001585AE30|nr:hypothetical protein [Pseudarthrobacter sp. C4D7]NUT71606.1 hypothetical protein [Pseudarthrobacter sp. C4D7]